MKGRERGYKEEVKVTDITIVNHDNVNNSVFRKVHTDSN